MTNPQGFRYSLACLLALTRKKLLQESAYRAQFVVWLVAPVLFVLPFIFQARFYSGPGDAGRQAFSSWAGTGQYIAFIAVGAAMYHWVTNLMWEIGFSFKDEQDLGTLEQLFLTPCPRWILVVGNSLAHTLINSATTLIIFLLIHLGFGLSLKIDWPLVAFVSVLSWLALYGLGFVFAGLVMLLKEAQSAVSLTNEITLLLAGVTFPLSVLPAWLRGFARLTPLAWVLSTLRAIILEGRSWGNLSTEILVLSVLAATTPVLGFFAFRWFERKAKTSGNLSLY